MIREQLQISELTNYKLQKSRRHSWWPFVALWENTLTADEHGWEMIDDQVRTIDKIRVIKKLGVLNEAEVLICKKIIKETFVD